MSSPIKQGSVVTVPTDFGDIKMKVVGSFLGEDGKLYNVGVFVDDDGIAVKSGTGEYVLVTFEDENRPITIN